VIPATLKWIFCFVILAHSATAAEGWSAIDGDTVVYRGERIRLQGIDAPEIHPCRCQAECNLGYAAKGYVQKALRSPVVSLERFGLDRYGRTLGRISVAGNDLGESLVGAGLARPWDGKRRSWCQ
jgi:micrococcal nuclease